MLTHTRQSTFLGVWVLMSLGALGLKADLNPGVLGAKLMELGDLRYQVAQKNILYKDSKGYVAQQIDPTSLKEFQKIIESNDSEALAGHTFEVINKDGVIDENEEALLQRQALNEVKLGERSYRSNLDLELMAIKLEVH